MSFIRKLSFEHRLLLLAVLTGLPATVLALVLAWTGNHPAIVRWGLTLLLPGLWLAAAVALRGEVIRPLQTIANLLAALREEDFSIRASGAKANDPLGEVFLEINTLSSLLQEQRLGALEATALLRTVMEEIDVAVFTFDQDRKLKLVNRAGQKLLAQPAERLLERTAGELNLAHCLEGESSRTLQAAFPGGLGRWSMKRSTFWQGGKPRHLLVMADLSRALREEERQAWQRLVRVLGHEINNSLAPIKSISGSLDQLLAKDPLPSDWREDVGRGLGVIAGRAEALGRFMATYTQLARLPPPKPKPFTIGPWLQRVAGLETRVPIVIEPGPDCTLNADSDQLEQLLINLLRNAVDAVLQSGESPPPSQNGSDPAATTSGGIIDSAPPKAHSAQVSVTWRKTAKQLEICVRDNGPGLANPANLFVPFFTTKPGGSGIGLVLCRQIAEAHNGSLILENRPETRGCNARLLLPLG